MKKLIMFIGIAVLIAGCSDDDMITLRTIAPHQSAHGK